jgi:hypothetical protein
VDWSNESYVRLYSRDTKTWILMGWQAHLLIGPMMRRLDRSGILEDVRDAADLAVILADGTPIEIVEAGLAAMIKHNVIVVTEKGILMPNFMEAQSASKSDKLRQKESRDNRRLESQKVASKSQDVTKRSRKVASKSQDVTGVTNGHNLSLSAVLHSTVHDNALPSSEDLPGPPIGEQPASGYNHQSLIAHYHDAFIASRGSKPVIGGREAKAIKELLAAVNGELIRAKSIITNAFTDQWWGSRVTILDIVKNPSRFMTAPLASNKPEKWGPGGGNGPQPNDPNDRYKPRIFE